MNKENINYCTPILYYSTTPLIIVMIFIYSQFLFPQAKTNLDIFYSLVDSSVIEMIKELPADKDSISLELNLGESYSVFNNRISAVIISSGKKITVNESRENIPKINFVIDQVNTEYGEMFRDGFLGEYLIPRNLYLGGNFVIHNQNSSYRTFNYSFNDTVRVDNLKTIENESFPFTMGKIPSEPFFSGIIEPVIAIGTAAIAVILFFTIRSK